MPKPPPEGYLEPNATRDRFARMAKYWPEIVSPESDISLALYQINSAVQARTLGILKRHRLSPSAYDVLFTLRSLPAAEFATPTDICEAIKLSSSGMTKVLYRLKSRRLIRVGVSRRDGRRRNVTLSAQGRTLIERVAAEVAESERALFQGQIGRAKLHYLRGTLMDILAEVEEL